MGRGGVRKGGRGCSGMGDFEYAQGAGFGSRVPLRGGWEGGGRARPRRARGGGRGGRSRTLHERSVQQGEHVLLHERGVHPGVPILEQLVDAVHERHARELVRLERILHRRVRRRAELLDHGREGRARISRRVRRARLAARSGARADATSDEEGGRRPPRWPRRQLFGADTSHHRSLGGRSRARSVPSVVWAAEISPRRREKRSREILKRKISEKISAPFSNDLSATTCPPPRSPFSADEGGARGCADRTRSPRSRALSETLGIRAPGRSRRARSVSSRAPPRLSSPGEGFLQIVKVGCA